MANKKRKTDIQYKPRHKTAGVRVGSTLSAEDAEKLDTIRGKVSRGEALRRLAFSRFPAPVPQVNLEKWREAARVFSALSQLAKKVNAGAITNGHVVEKYLASIERDIRQIRDDLIDAEPRKGKNNESED